MEDELFQITHDTYNPYEGNFHYNQAVKKDQVILKSFLIFLALIIVLILMNRSY
jgi:hypothetical protein